MKISDKQLDEFISIYKEEFGEELDRAQAQERASNLLRLYETLASRPPREAAAGSETEPKEI